MRHSLDITAITHTTISSKKTQIGSHVLIDEQYYCYNITFTLSVYEPMNTINVT